LVEEVDRGMLSLFNDCRDKLKYIEIGCNSIFTCGGC
jgi:hypothetical protein